MSTADPGATAPSLTVAVTDHERRPVAGAEVSYVPAEGGLVTAETDARGRARFDASPVAPATVTVIAAGLAPDSRAVGGGYPTRPDGVEQFLLGPVGWPHYYRGRVRVPFQPVLDAVGVRVGTTTEADGPRADQVDRQLDVLPSGGSEPLRFADDHVVVVRLPELREPGEQAPTGDSASAPDAVVRDVAPGRARRLDDAVRRLNRQVEDTPALDHVGALVELDDRGASFLTDSLVVSFLTDDADPVQVAARHGLEVVKQFNALPRTYVLRSPAGAGYDLLDRIEAVASEPTVRYAEPDLVSTVEHDDVTPNDFLFGQQWDHRVIGTPRAWQVLRDLNAATTFGDPAVTIAVVDNGVDAGHPALNVTLTDGQPKIRQLFDFGAMVAHTNAVDSVQPDHGMCTASASAGATDNGEGTSGVAGNCHVIATRHPGSEARYAELYLWLAGLDADSTAAGFPAQLADGVDVITNSFGSSVDSPISALMQETFDALTDQGRGGRGTALFFSAGNDSVDLDTTNRRPWSMYGRCYGVAAATLADDGVTEVKAGYSNFGSTVDFCTLSNDNGPGGHNPPTGFGAFTGTRRDVPGGTAVPGTISNATSLSAASAAGTSTITVASVAGAVVGGSVLVGPAAAGTSRGRTITSVNAGARTVGLDMALPAAFATGTVVGFGPREYRTDFGGTSYATPVTAGVAALMYSANPQLSWQQVGDILRATAVKIDTGSTDPVGRWRDGAGRISTDVGYAGPLTSEWYGAGRIDAGAAVARAAWTVDLVTDRLQFKDVPEGETTFRAVRWDVHSLHASTFSTVTPPGGPFSMPLGQTDSLTGTADYALQQEGLIWVSYTGHAPGSSTSRTITVRHDQTGRTWSIPITANSIARRTACVELVLDSSGSMDAPSGVGANRRIDVLHYSAGILAEAVHEGDGVGVVGFDTDAGPVLSPPVGPLAEPNLFDPVRDSVRSAITSFAVNPAGMTSIGDGLQLAQSELGPVTGFDSKATVVFTDGFENSREFIADVAGSITDRTYAVALGRAENIRPVTLTAVTKGTGGYCVLTDDLDTDSRYKLAKYFLQILAGVKNDQIVVDPPVTLPPGVTVDVPFVLAETDFVVDAYLLTEFPQLVEMTLVTPDGDVVDPAFMASLTGRNYVRVGQDVVYYRLTLPAPIGSGARAGEWLARFHVSEEAVKKASRGDRGLTPEQVRQIIGEGVRGTVLVHASSDLRMTVDVRQDSFEPGAKALLHAELTEYDVPVEGRAEVQVVLTDPGGGQTTVVLPEVAPGVFEEATVTGTPGVWSALFQAHGKTFHGTPFTREDVRTIVTWEGGDRYEPREEPEPEVKRRRPRGRQVLEVIRKDPRLVELLSRRLESADLTLADLERELV